MKYLSLLCGIAVTVAAASASAQTVDVDTFETYADEAALDLVWKGTAGNGAENPQLGLTGGADSTPKFLKLLDVGGYTGGFTGANIMTPPTAGNYKVSFYYKNGVDGEFPLEALKASLTQNGTVLVNATLSEATNPTTVTEWTFVESGVIALDNTNPLTVEFSHYSDQYGSAEPNYSAAFDQIILTRVLSSPPVVVLSPDPLIRLSRTRTISANVSLGSGTYTQVEFDVGNNGTVEFTDTVAPYEFSWDTLGAVPQGTSGTVALKVTATDSSSQTGSVTKSYFVDNRFGGREFIVNSDFSAFQGTGFGANLPVGWVEFQPTGNATYGPGLDRFNNPDQALQVTFIASDFSQRYTLRSVGVQGAFQDLQAAWWGKGASCRLYYATSTDGVTYVNNAADAGLANNSNWVSVIETPLQQLGLTDTSFVAVATHQFGAGSSFYDDVTVQGIKPTPNASVNKWNLY